MPLYIIRGLQVFDPLDKKNFAIPPSGSIMGIYARSDNSRGVHKAPANEVVRACVGLDCQFNKGEQDILNPKGINLIRAFPGMGIRVWVREPYPRSVLEVHQGPPSLYLH